MPHIINVDSIHPINIENFDNNHITNSDNILVLQNIDITKINSTDDKLHLTSLPMGLKAHIDITRCDCVLAKFEPAAALNMSYIYFNNMYINRTV